MPASATISYTVTFERIGRSYPEPLTFAMRKSDVTPDFIAQRIFNYATKFLRSREFSVAVNLKTGRGDIDAGRFGRFRIARDASRKPTPQPTAENSVPTGWLHLESTLDNDYRPLAHIARDDMSGRCGVCQRKLRSQPKYRIYVQELVGRGSFIVPLAYDLDQDDYEESAWMWIGPDCAKKAPDGYVDEVLASVRIGQRVRFKSTLMVRTSAHGETGTVSKVDGDDIQVAVLRRGILGLGGGRVDHWLITLDCLEKL